MWDDAHEKFYAELSRTAGMAAAKRDTILGMVSTWDELSPAVSREMSKGNHIKWYSKHALIYTGEQCKLWFE
jgi:hypothetical protein